MTSLAAPTDTRFALSDDQAAALAKQFGTPLYVVDEAHFRARVKGYREAFLAAYPDSEITYASKANSTIALIKIVHEEGCAIDVASEGELRAALHAGVPASHCHLHGNNKLRSELEFAIAQGIGQIIVDHFGEIELLAEFLKYADHQPQLVLRLAPGVDPVTHAKISTGQADTKFGFNITDGSAAKAVDRMLALHLNLVGFHCHVGSQLLDPSAQQSGGELIARFAADTRERTGFRATYLNVGGGLGVRYTDKDEPMGMAEYCRLIVEAIGTGYGDLTGVTLAQEPGRSLIAESGVTLYEVGVVKEVPAPGRGTRTYVCIDGGLSDNPRPVMYGSKYTVLGIANRTTDSTAVTVSGRHCETDKMFEDVNLPADIHAGDLIQVLCTGAYNSGMSSNYNRFPRPAMVLVQPDGSFRLIQRRDSWDEMFARELTP